MNTAKLLGSLMAGKRLENWGKCPICKETDYMSIHTCPPSWDVRHKENDEDESRVIYAESPKDAAIRFVDNGDYEGETYEIAVRPAFSDEPWKTYNIHGEETIVFYADEEFV